MDFAPSARAADLTARVRDFMAREVEPAEPQYHRDLAGLRAHGDPWQPLPLLANLQAKARAEGLWNLFLPKEHAGDYAARFGTDGGEGLTNVDYAPIAEATGRSFIAPYVFNCNAPDTGNMEVLLKYGDDAQRREWLEPLLDGRIRSAFTMTEPEVASSDATNMEATAVVSGAEVLVVLARAGERERVVAPDRVLDDLAQRVHVEVEVLRVQADRRIGAAGQRAGDLGVDSALVALLQLARVEGEEVRALAPADVDDLDVLAGLDLVAQRARAVDAEVEPRLGQGRRQLELARGRRLGAHDLDRQRRRRPRPLDDPPARRGDDDRRRPRGRERLGGAGRRVGGEQPDRAGVVRLEAAAVQLPPERGGGAGL